MSERGNRPGSVTNWPGLERDCGQPRRIGMSISMTMRRVTIAAIAAAALPLALAGCGTDDGDAGGNSVPDVDNAGDGGNDTAGDDDTGDDIGSDPEAVPGEWVPQTLTLDGETYSLPDTERTANALVTIDPGQTDNDGGNSGVYVGCNSTGTDMSIEGDTLRSAAFVSTMMACGEEVDQFERGTVDLFESDPTFALSDSGDTLTLTADNGDTLTLTRGEERPITGIRWRPESIYVDGEDIVRPGESDTAYLEIEPAATPEDGSDAQLYSGCIQLNATVVVEPRSLTVSDSVRGASEMACSGPVTEFEEGFFGVFEDNPAYTLTPDGDSLTLTTDDGDSMTLTRDDAS